MSIQFFPYISFPGNGSDAMTYYHEIFGGELNAMTYGDFPAESAGEFPFPVQPDALAHAQLKAGDLRLTGGDAMDADAPGLESNVYSFLLSPESVEEAEVFIRKFTSTGGETVMPFELAPWGSYYGQVRDRFGVLWSFDVEVGHSGP
ncbi:VOC family protein [Corynebacterium comes]|uniref:Glyoxalase/fosfomycin resistance/dioxygenase domain-containing protein n=1 Tax=Corynebacterium comes TaxID=2675218 RepID=A0A6B8W0R2_9CORY|nr:VOC family protein [Corynebacterium comes]QGU05597.1 hypothetical protein CETAM_11825 [Corynebacterium comes]